MSKEDFLIEEFKKYKVFLFRDSFSIHITLKSGKAIFRFITGRLKKNKVTEVGKKRLYEVYQPKDSYAAFIDILRNEKPLYFFFSDVDKSAYITTSDEPVGEGEG